MLLYDLCFNSQPYSGPYQLPRQSEDAVHMVDEVNKVVEVAYLCGTGTQRSSLH